MTRLFLVFLLCFFSSYGQEFDSVKTEICYSLNELEMREDSTFQWWFYKNGGLNKTVFKTYSTIGVDSTVTTIKYFYGKGNQLVKIATEINPDKYGNFESYNQHLKYDTKGNLILDSLDRLGYQVVKAYEYDYKGRQVSFLKKQMNSSGTWNLQERELKQYNSFDSLIFHQREYWYSSSYCNCSLKTYGYDSLFRRSSFSSFGFKDGGWVKEKDGKIFYPTPTQVLIEEYDSTLRTVEERNYNNKMLIQEKRIWRKSPYTTQLKLWDRSVFRYNSGELLDSVINYTFQDTGWKPSTLNTYSYGPCNKITNSSYYIWISSADVWGIMISDYDFYNNNCQLTYSYGTCSGCGPGYSKYEYSNDGLLIHSHSEYTSHSGYESKSDCHYSYEGKALSSMIIRQKPPFKAFYDQSANAVKIQTSESGMFYLLDLQGRTLIEQGVLKDGQEIPVSNVNAGIYIYYFENEVKKFQGKLIKED